MTDIVELVRVVADRHDGTYECTRLVMPNAVPAGRHTATHLNGGDLVPGLIYTAARVRVADDGPGKLVYVVIRGA